MTVLENKLSDDAFSALFSLEIPLREARSALLQTQKICLLMTDSLAGTPAVAGMARDFAAFLEKPAVLVGPFDKEYFDNNREPPCPVGLPLTQVLVDFYAAMQGVTAYAQETVKPFLKTLDRKALSRESAHGIELITEHLTTIRRCGMQLDTILPAAVKRPFVDARVFVPGPGCRTLAA